MYACCGLCIYATELGSSLWTLVLQLALALVVVLCVLVDDVLAGAATGTAPFACRRYELDDQDQKQEQNMSISHPHARPSEKAPFVCLLWRSKLLNGPTAAGSAQAGECEQWTLDWRFQDPVPPPVLSTCQLLGSRTELCQLWLCGWLKSPDRCTQARTCHMHTQTHTRSPLLCCANPIGMVLANSIGYIVAPAGAAHAPLIPRRAKKKLSSNLKRPECKSKIERLPKLISKKHSVKSRFISSLSGHLNNSRWPA